MENVNFDETLENTNAFFYDKDIKNLYNLIADDKLQGRYENDLKLTELREDNYKRYNEINMFKYEVLPQEFNLLKNEIKKYYNLLSLQKVLNDNLEDSKNNKIILDNIYTRITRIDNMVNSYLKQITKYNDQKQQKFNIVYFKRLDINKKLKKELIEEYNDLVLHSSQLSKNPYKELEIQLKRKEYIDDILKKLNIEEGNITNLNNKDRLDVLNILINKEIKNYKDQIQYLEDLIPEGSKYVEEFNNFIEFFNKLIAYDDTNYESARQIYDILNDELRIKTNIENFESLFANEREYLIKEENFIREKLAPKNITNSINYITANYMDTLTNEEKTAIGYICDELNEEYNIDEVENVLREIVKRIWEREVTSVYSYNPENDYCFICSNNQFIDEKYQTILITKKEIERVNDYEDYQIGFICGYNDNILYITENNDIMDATEEDMSNLKTPLQLEQEFMNFKICNRIALNGFKTKIEAVYLIDDGNLEKYEKALELANMYKIPLIKFRKS